MEIFKLPSCGLVKDKRIIFIAPLWVKTSVVGHFFVYARKAVKYNYIRDIFPDFYGEGKL